jgi:PAS domain S-box-containing protein
MTSDLDIRLRSLWAWGETVGQTGCWEHVAATGELLMTANLVRIFGFEAGTSPSSDAVLAAIDPDDRPRVAAAIARVRESGGEPQVIDHRITRPDGERRHLRMTAALGQHRSTRPGSMIGWVHDITDSHAEREIAVRVAHPGALVESEESESAAGPESLHESRRLLNLLEQAEVIAQTGSWEFVRSTGEVLWSDNCHRIFGVEPGEVELSLDFLVAQVHPRDRARFERALETIDDDDEGVWTVDYRIVRPDGDRRHLRSTVIVAEQREHRPYRVVGVVQDLTDRRSAEREIAAHVAVQEALAEWDALEPGARGLMARLAAAFDCDVGVFWVPADDVLVARVFWHAAGAGPLLEAAARATPLRRGSGLSGSTWAAGKPLSWTVASPTAANSPADPPARDEARGALAIPALMGADVLAVVELRTDREIRIGERLMRSLYGISHELGHFLSRRGGELAVPLLTRREQEVLQLAAAGFSARQTAEHLTISPATVRTHLENVYVKLHVSDKSSAVATAMRLGIID